ncbi:MAG: ABC transporter permease [Bdellovibrionota bacterium]
MAVPISWNQVRTLTSASIRSRYRNTAAGLIWVLMSPVLMFTAQAYAFKIILKIQVENYPLFLLVGLLPWIFMSTSIAMCTPLFANQARLLKSFPIHPMVLLLSTLIDNFVNFLISLVIIFAALMAFFPGPLPLHLWLMPIPLISIFISTAALTWVFATVQVFFNDLKFILDFIMSVAFFLTPICYPAQFVGAEYEWIVNLNPFAILLAPVQALSQSNLPADYGFLISQSFLFSAGVFALAWFLWNRRKNSIYFRL